MSFSARLCLPMVFAVMVFSGCAPVDHHRASTANASTKPVTAPATSPADGLWYVDITVESFFDGHLGHIARTVEVAGGRLKSSFREGRLEVAMTLDFAGGRAKGQMAVDPGARWNAVSIPFEGPIVDGALHLDLSGMATYEIFSGFRHRDRDARALYVELRLEKQPSFQ